MDYSQVASFLTSTHTRVHRHTHTKLWQEFYNRALEGVGDTSWPAIRAWRWLAQVFGVMRASVGGGAVPGVTTQGPEGPGNILGLNPNVGI